MVLYCSKCKKEFNVKENPENATTFLKTVKPPCPYCNSNKYINRTADMTSFDCGRQVSFENIEHKERITRHRDTQFAKNIV